MEEDRGREGEVVDGDTVLVDGRWVWTDGVIAHSGQLLIITGIVYKGDVRATAEMRKTKMKMKYLRYQVGIQLGVHT